MQYDPKEIDKKWQAKWAKDKPFAANDNSSKPKYYVLDMFPYPSGAGLHVGHPLGYIASDIVSRYKRLKGFNVLHPMGYDSFGLPAEQYAIQTGQHPAKTTEENIATYRRQMDSIGFSFDWDREVRTSDPSYYKWTQWIFLKLYDSWYCKNADEARPIARVVEEFKTHGNANVNAHCDETPAFTAEEWNGWNEATQQTTLLNYRIAYLSDAYVNWCPALGTVLANDEVKDGFSERGGHPVERKLMKQWSMRITAYAQRLLDGLDDLDWSESLKEQQRNWIGRSEGALLRFRVLPNDLSPNPSPEERGAASGYNTADPELYGALKDKAKEMRRQPTEAEEALWQELRRTPDGHHFRRQHIIGRYIADFVCLKRQLIVEVDGNVHDHAQDEDAARTSNLETLGYQVIRFSNHQVLKTKHDVVAEIIKVAGNRPDYSIQHAQSENHGGVDSPLLGRGAGGEVIEVFTTRPDTIFGVSFLTLAPEHELVSQITTAEQQETISAYIIKAKSRSDRDRMADVKTVSGAFTGAYAEHPFTGAPIPIWIGDYVLAGYGTGAVMAVPSGDQRDWNFATHFGLPIPSVIAGSDLTQGANESKDGVLENSDFLNGLKVKDAIKLAIQKVVEQGFGKGNINYRLRDAVFGRQRYWGEPIPMYYKDGIPFPIKEEHLPVVLPEINEYLPTETGEPPLARAKGWGYDPKRGVVNDGSGLGIELSTMPGWAGSSWYFLRYMDPHNTEAFASKDAINYWQNVDMYVGGSEHATGHLLYVRFWTKFLKDLGYLPFDEPAKKLVNQGMIQGRSNFVFRVNFTFEPLPDSDPTDDFTLSQEFLHKVNRLIDSARSVFISVGIHQKFVSGTLTYAGLAELLQSTVPKLSDCCKELNTSIVPESISITPIHVDVNMASNDVLDVEKFKNWREGYRDAEFILEEGKYICGWEVEKMSKSKWNVVNPDDIISKYGADTLRLYEMFLGPLEDAKPWNTNGIEGTYRFLRKFWNLFLVDGQFSVSSEAPSKPELKALHATIRKIEDDIEKLSLNTSISQFMICVNELTELKCNKRAILEPLTIVLSSFAPHIAEELWEQLGNTSSISYATYPKFEAAHLVEDSFSYPISFNGKTKMNLELSTSLSAAEVEAIVIANPEVIKRLEGATPKKVIVVVKRIVNVVV